jgi:hypothetical protein
MPSLAPEQKQESTISRLLSLSFVETVYRVYGQTSLIDLCQTSTGTMKKPAGIAIAGSFILLRFFQPYKA